jgi:tripartite-type tricarboxylate transporter receptor subunit TctC
MLLRAVAATLLILSAVAAFAQEFPTKLVRVMVGGGPDAIARLVAEKLGAAWGQPVVVESRPAVGGTLMSQDVARAPADGHTLMFCSSGQIMVVHFYPVTYDMVRDFAPVTQITTMPWILAVMPALPVASVKELIALAKQKPGTLNFASAGPGTPPHLVGEMFKQESGTNLIHVPYKTVAQASADLAGGHVQVMFIPATAAIPMLATGSVRGLAVTTKERSPALPQLPTMEEAGVTGVIADAWNGYCAPAGTPAPVIAKLRADITKAIRLPDVAKRIADLGNTIVGSSPEEFGVFVKAEAAKWEKYAKSSGASLK